MRIAVISGGGADGAVTVGRLQALNQKYDKVYGISTGAIMATHTALGNYVKLQEFYENVKQEDITEDSAFKENGRLNVKKAISKAVFSLLNGKTSIGESKNLRKTIEKGLNISEFEMVKRLGKTVKVGVFSQTFDELVYFNSSKCGYNDWLDWVSASGSPPVVFSMLEKSRFENTKKEQWCDGGIGAVVPLMEAIYEAREGDVIDVFLHTTRKEKFEKKWIENIPHNLLRSAKSVIKSRIDSEITNAIPYAQSKKVALNVYWMDFEVNENSLVFLKKEMVERIRLGRKWALEEILIDRY